MTSSLNERFKAFLTQLPATEAIDELELPVDASEERRADFLVENRKIIVELKSLECDPEHKVHAELEKHQTREEYPLFYGDMEVHKILKHFPDGKMIMQRLIEKISRSIEQGFRSADKQIGSTKSILGCPDSLGLLVMLNEGISVLSPEVVAQRVSQQLTRTDCDGTLHYRHVTSVWILFENYTLKTQGANRFQPSIVVDGPAAEGKIEFSEILDKLQRAWAAFNKVPFFSANVTRISDSDFVLLAELEKQKSRYKPRHERWRQQYRENPYLRDLSDDAVLSHGARLFFLMAPTFLKNGRKQPAEEMSQFMQGWTHFLEEVRFRGLDLKKMPKWTPDSEPAQNL